MLVVNVRGAKTQSERDLPLYFDGCIEKINVVEERYHEVLR